MKKLAIIFMAIIFEVPSLITNGQAASNSSGLASTYQEVERAFFAQAQGGEMGKEEEERLLKNLSPEMKTKLEEVKKSNKNKYYQLLRGSSPLSTLFAPSISGAYSLGRSLTSFEDSYKERSERIKKQIELEIDVEIFALKYKNADSANQQKIKSDLQAALNQLFDIRESQKQEEVKAMEKRLHELKESLQARKQNKNEIVQRRIQELLGDSKYLRWE